MDLYGNSESYALLNLHDFLTEGQYSDELTERREAAAIREVCRRRKQRKATNASGPPPRG